MTFNAEFEHVQLPNKPSELIRLAIADLKKVEEMKDQYEVDMGLFYCKVGKCHVCFAGAVMAEKAGYLNRSLHTTDFGEKNRVKFLALDYVRSGYAGLMASYLDISTNVKDREVAFYNKDRDQFYLDMEQLAHEFENEGN